MTNNYGLDDDYFKKKLQLIVLDIKSYSNSEMFNGLTTLAATAKRQEKPNDNNCGNNDDAYVDEGYDDESHA